MLPEVSPAATDWLVPATARLLKPVTNELNATSLATSSWYPVAPVTAPQFAWKLVAVIEVAAVGVGATGSVTVVIGVELALARLPSVART